jgi:hypothetical protein
MAAADAAATLPEVPAAGGPQLEDVLAQVEEAEAQEASEDRVETPPLRGPDDVPRA